MLLLVLLFPNNGKQTAATGSTPTLGVTNLISGSILAMDLGSIFANGPRGKWKRSILNFTGRNQKAFHGKILL